jgi:hypothetical protein
MIYFPLLCLFPLTVLTGTCKAFSLVNYIFALAAVLMFNVGKIHLSWSSHLCVQVVLENLWIFLLFFEIVNSWGSFTLQQPYIVL